MRIVDRKNDRVSMLYALCGPLRALFRAALPLTLCPPDAECATADKKTVEQLADANKDKHVLCVGGTRGIGKATADVIRRAGGRVTVVGRSAEEARDGISADLSTVGGCQDLERQLVKLGRTYDYVLFTIGVWPSHADAQTSDGLHKVFAIDLLSRHCVLGALVRDNLVGDAVRVMSVLASSQSVPIDRPSLRSLLEDATRPDGVTGLARGFQLMLGTAVAADAWLRAVEHTLPPDACLMGTFPGLLVTDLASSTVPGWLMGPFKLLQAPLSDSDEDCGLKHATILASTNAARRRVSYWAAPRLEAHEPHPLAMDSEMGAWLYETLEKLRNTKTLE